MWPLVRRSSLRSLKAKHGKRVVLIGLDGAGKTTVLRQLISRGAAPETLPTIGFTVQELVLDGLPLTVFDVGGQEKIRELWSQYCRAADGLVLVVDSGDPARFIDVRTELVKLLHGTAHLSHASVLVLANKQDQPQALSPTDLAARLRLHEMEQRWHIEGTVGLDGTGIDDGFDWLMGRLSSHGSRKRASWSVLSRGVASDAGDSERSAAQAAKELRALQSLSQVRVAEVLVVVGVGRRTQELETIRPYISPTFPQELETMRVQNEQLAARLFAVEQRNAEMASDHGQSALAHTQPPPCPPPPNPWRRPR